MTSLKVSYLLRFNLTWQRLCWSILRPVCTWLERKSFETAYLLMIDIEERHFSIDSSATSPSDSLLLACLLCAWIKWWRRYSVQITWVWLSSPVILRCILIDVPEPGEINVSRAAWTAPSSLWRKLGKAVISTLEFLLSTFCGANSCR